MASLHIPSLASTLSACIDILQVFCSSIKEASSSHLMCQIWQAREQQYAASSPLKLFEVHWALKNACQIIVSPFWKAHK